MVCLLHEKPFAGVNGSGKHVNFSIGNATQGNLLDPGDDPHANAQFLVFCAAVIRAVHQMERPAARRRRHRLQRPSAGRQRSAAGDHLGLPGRQLADIFDQVTKGGAKSSKKQEALKVGVDSLPTIPKDAGDRNRTSPFAFTGNRFEFRAVGSGHVDRRSDGRDEYDPGGVARLYRDQARESGRRRSGEAQWRRSEGARGDHGRARQHRLQRRRLLGSLAQGSREARPAEPAFVRGSAAAPRQQGSHRTVLDITACSPRANCTAVWRFISNSTVWSVGLEARTAIEMAKTIIFPAAIRYQGELASTCANLKAVGYVFDTDTLDKVTGLVKDLQDGTAKLETLLAENGGHSKLDHAKHLLQRGAARDGGGAQDRGYARRYRRRRPVAAGDLPGNALHHVEPLVTDRRHKRVSNKIRGAIGRAVESRQPGVGARRLLAWRG